MRTQNTTVAALSRNELHKLLDIGNRALSFDSLKDMQSQVLPLVQSVIGAKSGIYGNLASKLHGVRVVEGAEGGVPKGAVAKWCARYQEQDPVVSAYLRDPLSSPNNVMLARDVVDYSQFEASRFYHEFLRPQSIHHIMLIGLTSTDGKPVGVIGLHRSKNEREFSCKDVLKASLLAPSLRAATELINAREKILQSCDQTATPAGIDRPAINETKLKQFKLSCREVDVVELVCQGLTDALIADYLCISTRTVSNHLRSIYRKTSVHNRTALVYRLAT